MSDTRMVAMTAEQAREVDRLVEVLMRARQNERASQLMTLALAYKFAKSTEPAMPDNVVELNGWSRKAPCA